MGSSAELDRDGQDVPTTRRLSLRKQNTLETATEVPSGEHAARFYGHDHEGSRSRHHLGSSTEDRAAEGKDANISISMTSKLAGKTITPFLAKHIPEQYNPLGGLFQPQKPTDGGPSSTKFCYRHRPDLKCRRQADEPSMEQLQNVSRSSKRARHVGY